MLPTQEAADAGFFVSATLATASWLTPLNAVLTTIATLTAIGAGLMAGLYHFEAWRQKRRDAAR